MNAATPRRYVPLDELLDRPSVRILRALKRFDWASSNEVAFAAGIATSDQYERTNERMNFDQALIRLRRNRQIERRGDHNRSQYRITAAGRIELQRVLAYSGVKS